MTSKQVKEASGKTLKEIPEILHRADRLRSERKLDEALALVVQFMNENYEYVPALVLAAHILIDANRPGLAHPLMAFAAKLAPDEPIVWNNLGLCFYENRMLEQAEQCYIKALARNPNEYTALNNLAQLYNDQGQPQKAINCADKAIAAKANIPELHFNRGLAKLMLGNYPEGWDGYEHNLGRHKTRRERVYGTIPRWTGVNGLTIIAYGEQGIGDEISFASCIPDLIRGEEGKPNTVILECDKRLVGLYRRSFGCDVYGTRYDKHVDWPNRYPVDASVALGSLPGFYRRDLASFPGTPYLTPDPERRLQWRSLLASLGPKPKIGLTWAGGIRKTSMEKRSIPLLDLAPIWRQDATFISLQYKDAPDVELVAEQHGVKIHHWRHATQSEDMDNQAALMAELDLVITVQQTAVHLGGALGVPTWVLLPKAPIWRYGLEGTTFPWAKSVRLYRQRGEWVDVIAEVARDLRKWLAERNAHA